MPVEYEAVIGLEIHAEMLTESKMFCACPVVDLTQAQPNSAVCPVCAGMPGVLPVINQKAVEYALRVAIALDCTVAHTSIFARKNYFYPDLPKGYQISQYEQPLAVNGRLEIQTSQGTQLVRIRRVHLEEDTGKLTHLGKNGEERSLVDLNRAGVPLLEIVSEPDLHTAEQVRSYAMALRSLLRYLGVNSGDMQKGVIRIEPNVSVRPVGIPELSTRVEIKNLNSFRALERSVAYEIERQIAANRRGEAIIQQTLGWDEAAGVTVPQRSKETADDYRYFPEPDLPPLVISSEWVAQIRQSLPELPAAKLRRFQQQYELGAYDAEVLVAELETANYFEAVLQAAPHTAPKQAANWITGELFSLMNQSGQEISELKITPQALAELLEIVTTGAVNPNTAKSVLAEMFASGEPAQAIVQKRGLSQISDQAAIQPLVEAVLASYPQQVQDYLNGKENLLNWLFGQVMSQAGGRANPQVVRQALQARLASLKTKE